MQWFMNRDKPSCLYFQAFYILVLRRGMLCYVQNDEALFLAASRHIMVIITLDGMSTKCIRKWKESHITWLANYQGMCPVAYYLRWERDFSFYVSVTTEYDHPPLQPNVLFIPYCNTFWVVVVVVIRIRRFVTIPRHLWKLHNTENIINWR
jgi:hypothetical protein